MTIKQHISFELKSDAEQEGEPTSWSLHIYGEGDSLVLGLHWNDKPYPTHTFSAKLSEFERAIAILKGQAS